MAYRVLPETSEVFAQACASLMLVYSDLHPRRVIYEVGSVAVVEDVEPGGDPPVFVCISPYSTHEPPARWSILNLETSGTGRHVEDSGTTDDDRIAPRVASQP